jgi:hypothetical protein
MPAQLRNHCIEGAHAKIHHPSLIGIAEVRCRLGKRSKCSWPCFLPPRQLIVAGRNDATPRWSRYHAPITTGSRARKKRPPIPLTFSISVLQGRALIAVFLASAVSKSPQRIVPTQWQFRTSDRPAYDLVLQIAESTLTFLVVRPSNS